MPDISNCSVGITKKHLYWCICICIKVDIQNIIFEYGLEIILNQQKIYSVLIEDTSTFISIQILTLFSMTDLWEEIFGFLGKLFL